MSPLSNMQVRDIETLIHPYTQLTQHRETGPHIIERAEGVVYLGSGRTTIS